MNRTSRKLSERGASVVREYQKLVQLFKEVDSLTEPLSSAILDILTLQHAQLLVKLAQELEPVLDSEEV